MKTFLFVGFALLMYSCGKAPQKEVTVAEENVSVPPYDTVAIDSFSAGAVSVDVARRIRMSTIKYQDSLKKERLKQEETKLLEKAKEEQMKLQKKEEELKKKAAGSTVQPLPKPGD